MKEVGTAHWASPNAATNSSGWTGLPGGYAVFNGAFSGISFVGYWWSSTEFDSSDAINPNLLYTSTYLYTITHFPKNAGMSVRLIKD
jgi:uncharacterized protein (TIGR02145 family)